MFRNVGNNLCWLPRFSLLTMLLFAAIFALVIVDWQLSQEVGPLRTEVRKLRNEVGTLNIDDEKKIHALLVPNNEDFNWKWRIYLPKNRNYRLNIVTNPVPDQGYPEPDSYSGSSGSIASGVHVIEIAIRKDIHGTWILNESVEGAGENENKTTSAGSISMEVSEWLEQPQRGYMAAGVLQDEQIVKSPDERLLLLRLRPHIFTPMYPDSDDPVKTHVGTNRPATGPVKGLLIWIDEEGSEQ